MRPTWLGINRSYESSLSGLLRGSLLVCELDKPQLQPPEQLRRKLFLQQSRFGKVSTKRMWVCHIWVGVAPAWGDRIWMLKPPVLRFLLPLRVLHGSYKSYSCSSRTSTQCKPTAAEQSFSFGLQSGFWALS